MLKKLALYYRTIKHLKPIQIRYRLWYILRDKLRKLTGHTYQTFNPKKGHPVKLVADIQHPVSSIRNPQSAIRHPPSSIWHPASNTFTFLNHSYTFEGEIDWNIKSHGKLWAYNLNYFDYLCQSGMAKEQGLKLIGGFISQIEDNHEGLEPYPVSLRGINWIKFLSQHEIKNAEIDACLFAQYQILLDNLEYHILGNHVLENGCSLLFGAFYFQDKQLYTKAAGILFEQLDEQILNDGGHFERSAMYHCIMLERLLDSYNLLINNKCFSTQTKLERTLADYLKKMIGWLEKMQWESGRLPEVNDHVAEMQPSAPGLYNYANRLGLQSTTVKLMESGYRKYRRDGYELLADVGDIGPDYVPGHAHSDIFSFLLRINGQEIITDTGTSTYKNNQRRQIERSTSAHNTVVVNGREQNEVWSAFRVGRRGHAQIISEQQNRIAAQHDGYQYMNVIHERRFELNTNEIVIHDLLKGKGKNEGIFYVHFYPGVKVKQSKNHLKGKRFSISFISQSFIDLTSYKKAVGYNKSSTAVQANITFNEHLTTLIKILHP